MAKQDTSRSESAGAGTRRLTVTLSLAGFGVLTVIVAYAWAVDFVTLSGERTVYGVECAGGAWAGDRCNGTLVAGKRYRFRALKAQREVLFWTAGSTESAGRLTECSISSGRNWSCPANTDAARAITLQMEHGEPVVDAQHRTLEFHSISKVRWLLLRLGRRTGNTATP